jgi:hypothetical protein
LMTRLGPYRYAATREQSEHATGAVQVESLR